MSGWRLLALAVALAPGVIAWWSGRRLVLLLDDPALPERLLVRNMRVVQAVAVALALIIVLMRKDALWALPLAILSAIVASFPARKALLGEQWNLGRYLLFGVRFWGAWLGVWLLLAAAPAVVQAAGLARWPVAIGLAALLFIWNARYPEVFLWLIGARPLDLGPGFAGIIDRAGIRPPRIFRFGAPGGRVLNAFAIPSIRAPAVVCSDTLLELFEPDEQAAIFAHEVAHLEYYSRRVLLRANIVLWTLLALSTTGVALVPEPLSRWSPLVGVLVLLVLFSALSRRQAQEEASDRRAVFLCGDAEALVRALVKLHTLGRVPRRWGLDLERSATHPSLARRIQAIREAAGIEPPGLARPTVVTSKTPGTFAILEADRILWLDGVPAETPLDATTLRERAASYRAVRYSELVDLRVKAGIVGGPTMVATERAGRSQTMPLREADVAAVQAALDVVDLKLARAPAARPSLVLLGRALSVFLMLLGVSTGLHLSPIVAGLIGFIRPSRAALAMVGAVAAGGVVVNLERVRALGWHRLGALAYGWLQLAALAGSCAVAGVALWLTFRRRRGELESRVDVFLPLAGLGVVMVAMWGILLRWAATESGKLMPGMMVQALPDTWLAPLGIAAALFTIRHRAAWWGGVAALAASFLLYAVGAGWLTGWLLARQAASGLIVVRLRIPNPSLVILCGPAGSGKSTFAARHFPPTAIVSSDRCRAMLADDERNLAVSREAFTLFHTLIDRRLHFRRLAVADSTALRRDARRALLDIGRRHGVPVLLVVFDVSEDRCSLHDTMRERRVGRAVIARQVRLLHEALKTIPHEGFDGVTILDDASARHAAIEIGTGSPDVPD